ncbi:MAG: glycoside hydrolase family 3 N-terminal domain-containing protein, partial [Solirubrobacterales bacterium]
PGLGAASQDTNRGPATVSLDPASLADRDLLAFRAAFAERVPAVVLSLAFYAAYDPVTPGALADTVATGLLRDELGYAGVAITDDLGAGAVRSGYTVAEAAVLALAAGSDLIQVEAPVDQEGVRDALIAAVADGLVSETRLAEAAGRVLELKRAQGLLRLP